MLSKTKYLSGLQCPKRLWTEVRAPHHLGGGSGIQEMTLVQGIQVGKLAREHYPGGVLIGGTGMRAVAQTRAALAAGATCLFEATFVHDDILVRCDILRQLPGGRWELIEVKSATQVKPVHLHDLAVQKYVVAGAGLPLQAVKLMYINSRGCSYPDLASLFCETDVTRQVTRLVRKVPKTVAALREQLAKADEPDVPIGAHCTTPYPCPVKSYCWRDVPADSIFTIPRLSARAIAALVRMGVLRVQDIPADFNLSAAQRAYVARVAAGKPEIDTAAIAARLGELRYPIYFLDFETLGWAVPRYWGMRPYQHVPFQYSVHVLEEDGTLRHAEFLHEQDTDPRAPLAQALVKHIGPRGSVVVYNARFERTVLLDLAHLLPAYRKRLRSMAHRLWDQLAIFQEHYLDPRFEGSNSIKRVLPVLAPHMSYDDLSVRRGDQAGSVWAELIASRDPARKAELAAGLRAYCQRDTEAMVEIHRVLQRVVEAD